MDDRLDVGGRAGWSRKRSGRRRQEGQLGGHCLGCVEQQWEPKPGADIESDGGDKAQKQSVSRKGRMWWWFYMGQTADGGAECDVIPPALCTLLYVSQDTLMRVIVFVLVFCLFACLIFETISDSQISCRFIFSPKSLEWRVNMMSHQPWMVVYFLHSRIFPYKTTVQSQKTTKVRKLTLVHHYLLTLRLHSRSFRVFFVRHLEQKWHSPNIYWESTVGQALCLGDKMWKWVKWDMVPASKQLTKEEAGMNSCKITVHAAKKVHTTGMWSGKQ